MGWSRFFRRSKWDAERAAEIDAYIREETDDNIARGMTSDEARYAAQRKFGNAAQVREEIYGMNSIGILEILARDIGYALRGLRKSPGFTAIAIISLALGIGATTAIFSLMDTLLLRWLPVERPGELVQLAMMPTDAPAGDKAPVPYTSFSYPVIEAIRDGSSVFTDVCVFEGAGSATVILNGQQEPAVVERVGESYFDLLGVRPLLGRTFTPQEGLPVAVISYRYWQRRFGSDPNVLGRTFQFRGVSFSIVGVGPKEFSGYGVDTAADVWIPFTAVSTPNQLRGPSAHSIWWLRAIARLKPGIPPATAAASLNPLSAQILENEEALTRARDTEHRVSEAQHRSRRARQLVLLPGGRGISAARQRYSDPLAILMAVTSLVLLIACANIANLLLARGATRQREMAVRVAIGAGRGRLLAQLLTESFMLSILGAAGGLLFAWWAGRTLVIMVVGTAASGLQFQIDLRVLGFTAAATVATGLLFGLGPAFRASRGGAVPKRSRRAAPVTRLLVVAQAGLSLILLLGALLFLSTLQRLLHQDFGFQPDSVLIAWVDRKPMDDAQLLAAHRELMDRLSGLPGVISASLSNTPLFGSENWTNPLYPKDNPGKRTEATLGIVAPRYFETMQMPIVEGRTFTARDDAAAPTVAIINQTLARRLFPGESALGKRFAWRPEGDATIEIAGVVKDFRHNDLRQAPPPFVYLPMLQSKAAPSYAQQVMRAGAFAIRFHGEPAGLAQAIRREIIVSNGNVLLMRTQNELIESTLKQERLLAKISGFFGVTGLLLAAVGLYGLMAYTVGRRTSEMGIRMALGARPLALVRMVLRESVMLVLAGVAVGTVVAFAVSGVIEKFLFGVTRTDPAMTVLAGATLMTVAMLAALVPALRAARVNPMTALRHE